MTENDSIVYKSTLSFPPKESVRYSSVHPTFIPAAPSQPHGALPWGPGTTARVVWWSGSRPVPCRGRLPSPRSCLGCLGGMEPAEAVTKSLSLAGHTGSSYAKSTAFPFIPWHDHLLMRHEHNMSTVTVRTKCKSWPHLCSTELSTEWANLGLSFFIWKMGNDHQN